MQARRRNPSEFAWQFAQILEADCYLLAAPAIVDSPETKQALMERCGLSDVLRRARALDLALLSTGIMQATATSFRFGFMTEKERAELIACGAVGDLLFNFYNARGELVDHPVNQRIMSIPLADLRQAKRRIIASGGKEKAASIRGAMRLVGCSELITDEAAALALLEGD